MKDENICLKWEICSGHNSGFLEVRSNISLRKEMCWCLNAR
jgi:hypothetical protein